VPRTHERIIHPREGYAAPVSYAISCLEKARELTLEAVDGLSIDQLDAYAAGFPNSVGTLLYHIADIELDWLYCEILERDVPKDLGALFSIQHRDEAGRLSVVAGIDLAEHLDRLSLVRRDLLEQLRHLDLEDFYRVRRLTVYDVNPAWVLYHLLEHEAKHGDQIARIRRIVTSPS
jgi:uncharacterized damage-inducible protein DinB